FDHVLTVLEREGVEITATSTPRPNELHCAVQADQLDALHQAACRVLGADLILMAADDRRSVAGAFFVHYLFAHRTANWFLHASIRLDRRWPELPSLAPVYYRASRFEREIRDLFGIA